MSGTALVKRPVGDDLAVKVQTFRNEQLAEIEKNEAPLKKRVLIESFLCLAERYFGVTRDFIKNLTKEERAELLNKVFEEAKRRLRWQAPLFYIALTISVIGLFKLFTVYNDKKYEFPAFKIRSLYKWYMDKYGADDLEKAIKGGEFDKKSNTLAPANNGNFSIDKPTASDVVLPLLAPEVLESSETAVKSIAFEPAMLLEVRLAKFLKDNGIKVFNFDEVDRYLERQSGDDAWYWKPLREKDRISGYKYVGRYNVKNYGHYGSYDNEKFQCRPYSKLIPARVRDIVEKIEAQFEGKIHFLVSYFTNNPSDHFITIEALDIKMLVFDHWHDSELNQPGK